MESLHLLFMRTIDAEANATLLSWLRIQPRKVTILLHSVFCENYDIVASFPGASVTSSTYKEFLKLNVIYEFILVC